MHFRGAYVLGVVTGLLGCRGEELPARAFEQAGPGVTGERGSSGGVNEAEHAADVASTPGEGGASAAQPRGQGEGVASQPPLSAEECQAEAVTLSEIGQGRVREGSAVSVAALVASSQKFLVSAAKSGSCLWGAFVADAERSGVGTGLLLVSFGAPRAETEENCVSGSDGLPDDLRPGDRLSARGTLDSYAPAACEGVAPALQLRVDVSCPITRAGPGAPPEPASIDLALASRLADGRDTDLLREWGGALVRLQSVSAELDAEDGDAVFPFGVVRLQETPLEVHSRLYYFDLSGAGPRDPKKGPSYAYPTHFDSLTGIVFLDYCSWVLAPRDRCGDLRPLSAGCD